MWTRIVRHAGLVREPVTCWSLVAETLLEVALSRLEPYNHSTGRSIASPLFKALHFVAEVYSRVELPEYRDPLPCIP
jgi:hypothetical protein